jgi:hypothetical protein
MYRTFVTFRKRRIEAESFQIYFLNVFLEEALRNCSVSWFQAAASDFISELLAFDITCRKAYSIK